MPARAAKAAIRTLEEGGSDVSDSDGDASGESDGDEDDRVTPAPRPLASNQKRARTAERGSTGKRATGSAAREAVGQENDDGAVIAAPRDRRRRQLIQ